MNVHLPGCPLTDSAVPATTCTPCRYIRKGIDLAHELPAVDPRHEPGIGSLLVGLGPLFHAARGWIGPSSEGPFDWPDLTAASSHAAGGRTLRIAYSTTPLPGRIR